ncbi:MAG TPA: tetratricopeptide repeat protein [Verrucomicrobiota bacterium]|nr:tetratricopeptide repeat protein [Verrucomicrobiota bacterium]
MEQFTIPLKTFDLALLPAGARTPGSPEFREEVDAFFQQQFSDLGANGVVTVTPDEISVGWITPEFNPVDAAIAKLDRGQLREGAQLLELIRARTPDSPDVLYNLGVALSELGEFPRAIAVLRRLVEIDPDHLPGRVSLGVALGRSGNETEAVEVLTQALELAPDDVWAQKNLGGILFRLGRVAEARVHLETAVDLAPCDAQTWYILGETRLATGDGVSARDALNLARAIDPDGPIRDRAEAALNCLADSELPRNADGVNPEALKAMIAALKRLRSLTPEAAKQLTLQAALLGQNGLRFEDPVPRHRIEGISEPLIALEVACLIHAGVQTISPGAETGFPLSSEFLEAQRQVFPADGNSPSTPSCA